MNHFLFSNKFDPEKDLGSLAGKVIVVSGANQGIGFATAKHLARKGGKVYVGARTEQKGQSAVEKLRDEGIGSGEVIHFLCDLSTPALAKQSANGFLETEDRLDILVNNAACIFDYETKPAQDGITEMMMVNHFGTFQFTTTLLPLMKKTSAEVGSDVRIVTVASERHRNALKGSHEQTAFKELDVCKQFYLNDSMPTLSRYALSKLANALFSNSLHRQLYSDGIICLAVHPGVVNTTFADHLRFSSPIKLICGILFKSPDVGAYTSCWAAASPLVRQSPEKYAGKYIGPIGKLVEPSNNAKNEIMQDDLWNMTIRYLESCVM